MTDLRIFDPSQVRGIVAALEAKCASLEAELESWKDGNQRQLREHNGQMARIMHERDESRAENAALKAEVIKEHEQFLTAHRDNLAAALRIAELKAENEKMRDITERALLLIMDGDCEECGYDSDDETDTHAVNCEALALNLELNALRSPAPSKEKP